MFPKRERVSALLSSGIKEMKLLMEMSKDTSSPDDFI